jgi:RimJ/RimL family protein N-acetyltransferase
MPLNLTENFQLSTEIILHTERLHLRTLDSNDAAFYLQHVNQASFIQNIRDKGIRTIADAEKAIQTGHRDIQEKNGFSLYLVERKIDQMPIGLCGLVKREELECIDLGYALDPDFWGHGYAFEACQAVINFAQEALRQERLLAIVSPHNSASSNLLEKLGFQFRETISFGGGDMVKLYERSLNA